MEGKEESSIVLYALDKDPKRKNESSLRITNTIPYYSTIDELQSHFGQFGGRYIPETLLEAHKQLERLYVKSSQDPEFQIRLEKLGKDYVGRPTPLYYAKTLTEKLGGGKIYLKREDLAHTGAHKINNALGQCLLAKMYLTKQGNPPRIICETGAGQHGVATATACALLDLPCTVYMGSVDIERQKLNVFRMKLLGAKVIGVESGTKTLKDAVNEAMRDWTTNVRSTHYVIGSAIGPAPFPVIVRDFQSVIGREIKQQIVDDEGRLPDEIFACVGGGSNAIGTFFPFVGEGIKLIGVEAGGSEKDEKHCATLSLGKPGVLHGTKTFILQSASGQIEETESISAGLDYPGVGPEHAYLKENGLAEYISCTDEDALKGLELLAKTEGIIVALETAHAVWKGCERAKEMKKEQVVVINLSGRGDKDMVQVAGAMGVTVN